MAPVSHSSKGRRAEIEVLTVLLLCSGASILSTDLYTPSLPHLPELLGTTPGAVQLTMSLNLAVYSAATLICGPIADRIGRRRLMLWGMVGFLLATAACALAPSVEALIAARMVQGAFAASESVVTLLILREFFEAEKATKAMGLYGMGVGAFPALGPLIGGYVHVFAGWRANFWLMAGFIALAGLAALRILPETRAPEPGALKVVRVLRNYAALLGDRAVLRYLIPLAAAMGALFAFITEGPFLLIDRLEVPTEHYGYWYGLIVVFFMAGSLAVNRLADRVSAPALTAAGLGFFGAGALALALPIFAGHESVGSVIAAQCVFAAGLGLVFGGAAVPLLDAAGDERRGAASALMVSVEVGGAALGAAAVAMLHDGTGAAIAIVTLACAAIGVAGFFGLRR